MITRVEISGFKTFTDFSVDLAPLSVIAGANASGKSNFLDALRVISGMASGKSLQDALPNRGSTKDFFTKHTADHRSNTITIALELLVPPTFTDGISSRSLDCTRFRYELRITEHLESPIRFPIDFEKLTFIRQKDDYWGRRNIPKDQQKYFLLYQDKQKKPLLLHGTELEKDKPPFDPFSISHETSLLGRVTTDSDLHLQAIRKSLLAMTYSQLYDPDNFSNYHNRKENDSRILNELKDLALNHPEDLNLLSMRVGQIAKSIRRIEIKLDDFDRLSLIAEDHNGARYLSDSLSEGTLRTIALATFLFSKKQQQIILLEEPENGIDPRVLQRIVELLSDLATDFSGESLPHIQVICTTHSPALLEMMVEHPDTSHITAYLSTIVNKKVSAGQEAILTSATRIQPIVRDISAPVEESRAERMTLHQAKAYMEYGRLNSPSDA